MATVADWAVADVEAWIESTLLLPYGGNFAQAGIDGLRLVALDKAALRELGVECEEHVTCMFDHISVLRIQWQRSQERQQADHPRAVPASQKPDTSASFRNAPEDPLQHRAEQRKLGASVYPRVGSPILTDTSSSVSRRLDSTSEFVTDHTALMGAQVHGRGQMEPVSQDAHPSSADKSAAAPGEVVSMEFRGLLPVASQSSAASGGVSTTCSSAAGSGLDGPAQGGLQRAAAFSNIHQPARCDAVPSPNKLAVGRPSSEAMSRCSSAPSSTRGRRGPSMAAAEGASLFLSDQSRGAHFGTMPRDVDVLPQTLGPGPARYDGADAAACKISARVHTSIPKFNLEPRRTMEGMFVRGRASPGVGKYSPPARSNSRGGSFTKASRWGSRSAGGLPAPPPVPVPGPMSYKPNYAALSTVR